MRSLALPLALATCLACSDSTPQPGAAEGTDGGVGQDAAPPMDGGGSREDDAQVALDGAVADDAAVDAGEPAPTWPKPCADLYADELLPTFELTFTPDELAGLQADCQAGTQAYRPATFTYGGESVEAMVRLKGNWSWDCNKMQFVVSFNETDPAARFHGLRKLVLDAPWYDRTLLHERVGFGLFRDLGLPASCVNNAKLLVNGTYYGMYANVERLDKEYLQRNFEEPDGNLYQGGSELKTNEEMADTSDLAALSAAGTASEIAALVDMDEALSEWAAEAMLPALDNYWAGVEINWYLYHHPSRGFLFLPYDLDISFGDGAYTDGTLLYDAAAQVDPISYEHAEWKKEELVKKVLADQALCERFVAALERARAAYVPEQLAARVDAYAAQIEDGVAQDPHRPYSAEDHAAAVAALKAFFAERAAAVDAWLAVGPHCPAVW